MSDRARTCVFYSVGRRYADVLRAVRKHEPHARITGVVPHGYPITDDERALADEVVETRRDRYSLRNPAALWQLVADLRAAHYDGFVITFDSPKLRILAALSKVPGTALVTMDGRVVPIRPAIAATLAGVVVRNAWGRLVYAAIWLAVHGLRVSSTPDSGTR